MKPAETLETPAAQTRSGDGPVWRRAVRGVLAPALRLHHYRFIRSRLLQDALGPGRGDGSPPDRC